MAALIVLYCAESIYPQIAVCGGSCGIMAAGSEQSSCCCGNKAIDAAADGVRQGHVLLPRASACGRSVLPSEAAQNMVAPVEKAKRRPLQPASLSLVAAAVTANASPLAAPGLMPAAAPPPPASPALRC